MRITYLLFVWLIIPVLSMAQNNNNCQDVCMEFNYRGTNQAISFEWTPAALTKFKPDTEAFNLEIPVANSTLKLELKEIQIFTEDFNCSTKSHNFKEKTFYPAASKHYSGKIEGNEQSSVSLTVRGNNTFGIIHDGDNVYNLAYASNLKKHIIYNIKDVNIPLEFKCEQINNESYMDNISQHYSKSTSSCSNAVEVYFECDHDMFVNFSSDSNLVVNYVIDLFTQLNVLYANEDLPILISGISVWTSQDPYANGPSALSDFQTALNANGFSGDLAHLLTNDSGTNGGVAYVDELCGNSPYAYSDLVNSTEIFPAYSWDVQVVAHEMGHNFGSQHTHDCVWGPMGNEQIDDCGNVYGTPTGICYDPQNPVIPPSGGTIMSYCHLAPEGINLINGFGTEPSALMYSNYIACKCDNSTCNSATEISVAVSNYFSEPNNGNGASSQNATHADWFVFTPPSNGIINIESCGGGSDTRVWVWQGSCDQLIMEAVSDDDCDMGNGSAYASMIEGLIVNSAHTYYIEWDDRWSSNYFDWNFEFIPDAPGPPPCNDEYLMASGSITDTILHAKMTIYSDGHIMSGSEVNFKTGFSIDLLPGFEIDLGASFDTLLEDCDL